MVSYSSHMGIIRSVFAGSVTWIVATAMYVKPDIALGLAIVMAFLSESTYHRGQMRRLHRHNANVSSQLRDAHLQVDGLQRALTHQHSELNSAIEELQRRDAVGSPAARELLKRQEEAMTAASRVLEARHDRNDNVFESMERLMNMQIEQTAKMQRAMSEVLQHLISQPRGHFTMHDSVVVSDASSQDDGLRRQLREVNDWLKQKAVSSP